MLLADRVCAQHPEMRRIFTDAARFVLDADVAAAIDAVKTDGDAMHRALHLARPPHPITWIEFESVVPTVEYRVDDAGRLAVHRYADAEAIRQTAGGGIRVGIMAEDHDGIYTLGVASCRRDRTVVVRGGIGITEGGVQYLAATGAQDRATLAAAAGMALRFFLLLNTRNRVVRIIDGPSMSKLNKQRRRKGKDDLLESQMVKLDLSRPIAQVIRRGGTPNHRAIAAHVVRGHFKLRSTGIFWWSPFVRGSRGNAPPPDYEITATNPKAAARAADREAKAQ